jgi:hypothetical protein
MVTDIGPSTVESVAVRDSVRYAFQRKGFYARGYHWAFYYASGEIYWRRSADGITWDSATPITPSGETPTDGAEIAVWLGRNTIPAQTVHIAYADHDTDCPIYYRRGTIDGNGDLTWDSVWQSVVAQEGISYSNITVCIDDVNGFAFIGYTTIVRAAPTTDAKPRVIHSRQTDGTWSTYAGFPKILNATLDESWVTLVIPSGLDTIIALYARGTNSIFCDVYDVSLNKWDGQIDTGETIGADATKISATSQRAGKNATLDPKCVHVAYCDGSEDLQHIQIQSGAITGPHLIYTSSIAMSPSLSTRIYGGDVNNYRTLYVFWTPITDAPTADWVCYKKSLDAGVTWTKEDGSAGVELWREETGAGLSGVNIASSYFEEQHHATLPESYLGILYTNEGASPDYVRWAGLEFADPDEDLLCNTTIRNISSAELLGNAVIRQPDSAELLGTFNAQATAELLGNAIIRQPGSAELLGKADVGQNSQDLLGNAEIQQSDSAELLGTFNAQATAELLGNAIIRQPGSAELLGNAEIQQSGSAELLGNAEIQQSGSAELLGNAVIRQPASAELLCHFRTSTDEWAIQGASVEAYIELRIVV